MASAPALRKFTFTTHGHFVRWMDRRGAGVPRSRRNRVDQPGRANRARRLPRDGSCGVVRPRSARPASLVSGSALSLGTPWGLLRHCWVVSKLVITAFSTVILMIYMGTVREMAAVAADPVVALALGNPSPLLHPSLVLILLLAATLLAIDKPFGMTPYGTRQQVRARDDNQELVPTSVQ